ncbi:TlpA family protein disulfide reductase [Flammeovirga sp. MY04]|uniref:TlpA family protein disulfide reductase n=1 Tax=Flammeovirga sp. MY04 TaxID=1191459 RepID=UPI0008062873|nr:TlpA disulfide reductase family protein [Flammeovirga sp. MY04]ANQ48175.1 TlpA family protein disulfide reductase [Flammeovirga sp. MY04]
MKNCYFFILMIFFFSCAKKENSLVYQNPNSSDIKLVMNSALSHSEIEIPSTREGDLIHYTIDKNAFITLKDGDLEIEFYATPSSSSEIIREENNQFIFKGDLGKYNQSVFNIQAKFDHFLENTILRNTQKDELESKISQLKSDLIKEIPTDLTQQEQLEIKEMIALDAAFLHIKHAIQTGYGRQEEYSIPQQYDIQNFNIDVIEKLYNENFNYLSYYIPNYLNLMFLNDEIYQLAGEFYYDLRTDEFQNLDIEPRLKEMFVASTISESINTQGLKDNNEASLYQFLHDYPSYSHKEELIAILKNNSTMKDGNVAPIIHAFDANGEIFHLKNHEGKVVYINVWATWNENFNQQIKDIKALKSKYEGQDIEIISLSVDRDQQHWKDYIDYSGEIKNNIWTSKVDQFYSNYKVYTVPRFILIDKNGKLINSFAPAPDSKELDELIAEVL